jgi:ribosomal protein S18 acetylase RimI-like enzyme
MENLSTHSGKVKDVVIKQIIQYNLAEIKRLNDTLRNKLSTYHFFNSLNDALLKRCIDPKTGIGLGAFSDNRLVGYQLVFYPSKADDPYYWKLSLLGKFPGMQIKIAYLISVAIHEDFHGYGIGTRLMTNVLMNVKNPIQYIITRCHPDNAGAMAYLKKFGFRAIQKEYIHGESRYILVKSFMKDQNFIVDIEHDIESIYF